MMIINEVYNLLSDRLVDDVSRVYLKARRDFLEDSRISNFYENIHSLKIHYAFRDMEDFCKNNETKGWIIWGSDDIALYHYHVLSDNGYLVLGICSINDITYDKTIPVIGTKECIYLVNSGNYTLLCTSTGKYGIDTLPDAMNTNRVLAVENHLVGRCGNQYFDFFEAEDGESFLDGGSLDGKTTLAFLKWCNGNYNEIYAFEPNPQMADLCRSKIQGVERCMFFESALWSKNGIVRFDNHNKDKWDACISEEGNISVNAIAIDSILKQEHILFIKLDVEGAELEVLCGAKKCILKNNPRMAISVYHHAEDIFVIADYLMKLNPRYSFAIRHYHSDSIETVLYVFEE